MKLRILILTLFILAKFLIQYSLIHPVYELHRDEFLHLDQGNHLAWGYFSVPPVTSWISCLIRVLGNTVFWIKFFPALFGALTILLVWKTIGALKGNWFALIFGTSCITFSVLFRINILYQPNSLDILCWTLIYYLFVRYLNDNRPRWFYLMAVTLALGFLNKYNISFLVAGLLPAILLTPYRKIFRSKHLYAAFALFVLLVLPNLIWQYQNDFPVVRHLTRLAETQLVYINPWDFILTQLIFFPGTFLVILFALYGLIRSGQFSRYRLFFWSFCFTLFIFLVLSAKPYYALGVYPVYFAFGAVYLSRLLHNKTGSYIKPVFIFLPVLCFFPLLKIAFPNKSPQYIIKHNAIYKQWGLLRWEDGKNYHLPQDFADMLGWKELAEKADRAYSAMPHPEKTLVFCDNYGQAGAINYYSKLGIRAVSFNADYFGLISAYAMRI